MLIIDFSIQVIKGKKWSLWNVLLLCLSIQSIELKAQDATQSIWPTFLNVGDIAPPFIVGEWIKGNPINRLEKGHLYIIDFWSTWCVPCYKSMGYLSKVARKYKKQVTIVGINIWQKERYPKQRALEIIDSLGKKVQFALAFDKNDSMEKTWMDAFGEVSVPRSFIIDANGIIAWIGYPLDIKKILPQVLNKSWDIETEASKRKLEERIYKLDSAAREDVFKFYRSGYPSDYYGEPDSTLFYIDKIVKEEPKLKYAYNISYHTFCALLKTDMVKAYEFAIDATNPSNPLGAMYKPVIDGITYFSDKLFISPEIYGLGAKLIGEYGANYPKYLLRAVEWYWRANDKSASLKCLKKARKVMKKEKYVGDNLVW